MTTQRFPKPVFPYNNSMLWKAKIRVMCKGETCPKAYAGITCQKACAKATCPRVHTGKLFSGLRVL